MKYIALGLIALFLNACSSNNNSGPVMPPQHQGAGYVNPSK